jgi:hypothetical protein
MRTLQPTRLMLSARRVWLTRPLILVEIPSVSSARPRVPEQEETEPVQLDLDGAAGNTNQH